MVEEEEEGGNSSSPTMCAFARERGEGVCGNCGICCSEAKEYIIFVKIFKYKYEKGNKFKCKYCYIATWQ